MHRFLAPGIAFLVVQCLLKAERTPVTEKTYHLGTKGAPEWKEFAASSPHGRNLSLLFESKANADEATLFLRQDDVKQGWRVSLNGKRLGNLQRFESKTLHSLKVSPGILKDGENRLSVAAPATAIDDIFVGGVFLEDSSLSMALSRSFLDIRVTDLDDGAALPCRITITDPDDYLMPLKVDSSPRVAVRTGVVYSLDGKTKAGVLPGEYVVYASRGFEYGIATAKVSLKAGETKSVKLSIGREVPTEGWISCDPHIHVRTFSGHGDSTVEERIPTIAGEGLELPIATDHNHHADYRPYQRAAGATPFFTPVIGNEVTTKVGHFNAFPIREGAPLPNHKTESWPELFRSMRSTPGVEIILLNHPRNVHSNFSPTDPAHFHRVTGESKREGGLAMDAIEVITSAALQADYMGPFQDWFALLNSGQRLTAAGSSDTHDVNRYILGQGRTYLRCPDGDPAKIDVGAACRAFREGRALVSMGLLTKLKVAGRFEVGDLATG
ncbi:MAG: CehA/McbA family metallohydrolase, partial [Opitutales bacterium]